MVSMEMIVLSLRYDQSQAEKNLFALNMVHVFLSNTYSANQRVFHLASHLVMVRLDSVWAFDSFPPC